jgi:hypothetical protein
LLAIALDDDHLPFLHHHLTLIARRPQAKDRLASADGISGGLDLKALQAAHRDLHLALA